MKGVHTMYNPVPLDQYVTQLLFFMNGKKYVLRQEEFSPRWTLLEWIRNSAGLKGTKLGCGEGKCGACTVLLSHWTGTEVVHRAVNACLFPFSAVDGCHIITIEGIGNHLNMNPIQKEITERHGSQCGYCTPGFVMAMYAQLRSNPCVTSEEMTKNLDGNLCRCTGYRPILETARVFGRNPEEETQMVCPSTGKPCDCPGKGVPREIKFESGSEPIFPPALRKHTAYPLRFVGDNAEWYRPLTLDSLCFLKEEVPDLVVVELNSMSHLPLPYARTVWTKQVPELSEWKCDEKGITIGVDIPISKLRNIFSQIIREHTNNQTLYKVKALLAYQQMFRWFGNTQTRNVATLVGNILASSPISDVISVCWASHTTLNLISNGQVVSRPLDKDFFIGYHQVNFHPNEVAISLTIPWTSQNEFIYFIKQSKRKTDSYATVNCCFRVIFSDPEKRIVGDIELIYGGMGPTHRYPAQTQEFLKGKVWDSHTLEEALNLLPKELEIKEGSVGGSVKFRRVVSLSIFFQFFYWVKLKMELEVPSHIASALKTRVISPSHGTQKIIEADQSKSPIGQPVPHRAAHIQATGEAKYVDDYAPPSDHLHAVFVFSTVPHAKIKSIDARKALQSIGVLNWITAKDIPGKNNITSDHHVLFAEDTVVCVGFPIGLIVADTAKHARAGASLVEIQYEPIEPVCLTIDDAVAHNSFFEGRSCKVETGDPDAAFASSDLVFEGEQRLGGQEHLYLEPHSAFAIPGEDSTMKIYGTTQCLDITVACAASVLGVPSHNISASVVRLGGGFGGKETRNGWISSAAAVAAKIMGVPVKVTLNRTEDIQTTGQRERFMIKYKVGCSKDGRINAIDYKIFADAGWQVDLTDAVTVHCVYKIDNVFNVPNFRAEGFVTRTNTPNNTAFRGFGNPQAILAGEAIINQIASTFKLSIEEVREKNLYKIGDKIPCGQVLDSDNLQLCWKQCLHESDFYNRKKEVEKFNSENSLVKRGIYILPIKYGISYASKNIAFSLLQAGSLICIYKDGSVLVSHGGVEMGQGLNTKLIQIAAKELNIDYKRIRIVEAASDKVPNQPPTAASMGSDLWGGAVADACRTLAKRLQPIRDEFPDLDFDKICTKAWLLQIPLFATGFCTCSEGLSIDFNEGRGNIFNYFVYGAACAEVEVHCLTGDHSVRRCDLVMDIGESLNPAIDIGQIEGGFVQGYGFYVLEEILFQTNREKKHFGHMTTSNLGSYIIPSTTCVPTALNISLLKSSNDRPSNLYSSKAVGEPPLCLASAVFMAIKSAVESHRRDHGLNEYFSFESPATAERIRMACEDEITKRIV